MQRASFLCCASCLTPRWGYIARATHSILTIIQYNTFYYLLWITYSLYVNALFSKETIYLNFNSNRNEWKIFIFSIHIFVLNVFVTVKRDSINVNWNTYYYLILYYYHHIICSKYCYCSLLVCSYFCKSPFKMFL